MTFKPLLSANIEDGDESKLRWPMYGSPKLDGIRVVVHPELGPVTRSLKPVRNDYIRSQLMPHHYLDGEIIVGKANASDVFNRTQSAVQTQSGTPEFKYHVFDHTLKPYEPFMKRMLAVQDYIHRVPDTFLHYVQQIALADMDELVRYEAQCLEAGYEGIMVRRGDAPYKFGRSTFNEGILLKVKRFKDDEAKIVGFEELQRNTNEQTRDSMGYAKRSSHKAGKIGANTLGNFIVEHPSWGRFSCGSGLDSTLRDEIWQNQDRYLGRIITFKYFEYGSKEAPRFPIFKGFRDPE